MKSQGNSEPSTSQPAPGNASKALPVARTCREGEIIPRLQTAAFLGLYFICLWRWIDVRLIYHGGGEVRGFPSFYFGWDFARDFLRYPGGLTEYLSALASQSLFYSWCGALVLTLQAWLILACTQSLLNSLGARRFSLTAFAAPVLLLTLYGRYKHYSAPVATLAFACSAVWLHQRLLAGKKWVHLSAVLVLASSLYYVCPGGLLVYVLVVVIAESRVGRVWCTACVSAAALFIVPCFVGVGLLDLSIAEAGDKLLPFSWDPKLVIRRDALTLAAMYFSLPGLCAGSVVWRQIARNRVARKSPNGPTPIPPPSAQKSTAKPAASSLLVRAAAPEAGTHDRSKRRDRVSALVETVCLLATTLLAAYLAHDKSLKSRLNVDYCAWHRLWPELLAAAPANSHSTFVAAARAQAAYHTGRLTAELPLLRTADDLVLANEADAAHWKKSDLYFDLGYVNMALHHLTESVEFWGERPVLLQRLALVNFALGNLDTGRLYLNALSKVPFHARWARDYLRDLESDPLLEHNEEVSRLRGLMMKRDSVVHLSTDEELLSILAANPANRMAFEYLMTYYLLTKNLTGFVDNLPRARNFPGFELSTLWEEAVLVAARQSVRPLALKGRALDRGAEHRLEAMLKVYTAGGQNQELARSQLRDEYGKSYFFYYLFE